MGAGRAHLAGALAAAALAACGGDEEQETLPAGASPDEVRAAVEGALARGTFKR